MKVSRVSRLKERRSLRMKTLKVEVTMKVSRVSRLKESDQVARGRIIGGMLQ